MNDLSKLQSQFLLARGPRVSVVLPVRNGADGIQERIAEVVSEAGRAHINLGEIIVVDDGSDDLTWAALQAQAWRESRLRPIRLRTSFGTEEVREAGAMAATGEIVITLEPDAPASDIERLEAMIESGHDVVVGHRPGRTSPAVPLIRQVTGLRLRNPMGGTAAYRREVILRLSERGTALSHLPFAARRAGYRVGEMEIDAAALAPQGAGSVAAFLGAMSGIYGTERLCGIGVACGLALVTAAAIVPLAAALLAPVVGIQAPYGILSILGVMLMFSGLQIIGMALLGGLLLSQSRQRNGASARVAETMLRHGARD